MLNSTKQSCFIPRRYFIKGTHTHTFIHLAGPIDETSGPTVLGLANNLSKVLTESVLKLIFREIYMY